MKNLPEGMEADIDNQIHIDTETNKLYLVHWDENYNPNRHYLNNVQLIKKDQGYDIFGLTGK